MSVSTDDVCYLSFTIDNECYLSFSVDDVCCLSVMMVYVTCLPEIDTVQIFLSPMMVPFIIDSLSHMSFSTDDVYYLSFTVDGVYCLSPIMVQWHVICLPEAESVCIHLSPLMTHVICLSASLVWFLSALKVWFLSVLKVCKVFPICLSAFKVRAMSVSSEWLSVLSFSLDSVCLPYLIIVDVCYLSLSIHGACRPSLNTDLLQFLGGLFHLLCLISKSFLCSF